MADITAQNLHLVYDNDLLDLSFPSASITGGASMSLNIPGFPQNASIEFVGNGLVIQDGQLIEADITLNSNLIIGGLKFVTNGFNIHYTSQNQRFALAGEAGVEFLTFGDFTADFGPIDDPGLVIENGRLKQLGVGLSGNIMVAGLPLAATDLNLSYSDQVFSVWGEANASIGGLSVAQLGVTLGSETSPGLVIDHGDLKKLEMTVTGNLSLPGNVLSITGSPTLSYEAAHRVEARTVTLPYGFGEKTIPASDVPNRLIMFGEVDVSMSVLNKSFTVTASLGSDTKPGLIIDDSGLQRLYVSLDTSFNVLGLTADAKISGGYDRSDQSISIDGEVTVTTPKNTPVIKQKTIGPLGGKIYLDMDDPGDSYVQVYGKIAGKNRGIMFSFDGGIKLRSATRSPFLTTRHCRIWTRHCRIRNPSIFWRKPMIAHPISPDTRTTSM